MDKEIIPWKSSLKANLVKKRMVAAWESLVVLLFCSCFYFKFDTQDYLASPIFHWY
jgi:hypothetical protein